MEKFPIIERFPILSIYNGTVETAPAKPEVQVSKETLEKLADKYGFDIFYQENPTATFYFVLMPNYIFYAKEKKK
ncbi:MAG: hypothetical protein DRN15_09450 [Thermoprotei archaeon]|nr:MAG: hypothetical protein DRN15_09450 [Thermoprotei archaeon]